MPDAGAGTLVLHRFNGEEVFLLDRAELSGSETQDGYLLCLEAWCTETPVKTLEDTAELKASPHVTAYVAVPSLNISALVGHKLSVPSGYDEDADDWVATLYYCEHEDLDNNEIVIRGLEGGAARVRWTGTTIDVNHYDGSKPETRVEIEGRFRIADLGRER